MARDVWTVNAGEVAHLVERMFDPLRDDYLVIVSPASDVGRPRIDVAALSVKLPAGTEVAVLGSMAASNLLSDLVDEPFQCYGGGIRVIVPHARPEDNDFRNRLFTVFPDDDLNRTMSRIVHYVDRAGYAVPSSPVTPSRPHPAINAEQEAMLAAYAKVLAQQPKPAGQPRPVPCPPPAVVVPEPVVIPERVATPDPVAVVVPEPVVVPKPVAVPKPRVQAAPPVPKPVTAPPKLSETDLDRVAACIDSRVTQLVANVRRGVVSDLGDLFAESVAAVDRERTRAEKAERDLARMQRRYSDLLDHDNEPAQVYADPEKQFRYEVAQAWLTGTAEDERALVVLRKYSLGTVFLESLDAQIVPRGKTIQFVLDILTGLVWERRECKQFTAGPGGAGQRVRDDDAVAWRGNVKSSSHGAPRLTWWEMVDGTVELDHVGHHDDLI